MKTCISSELKRVIKSAEGYSFHRITGPDASSFKKIVFKDEQGHEANPVEFATSLIRDDDQEKLIALVKTFKLKF